MADKAGGKQPPNPLTSCSCIERENIDMDQRAHALAVFLEANLGSHGACNTYSRMVVVMAAVIITGSSHWPGENEEVPLDDPDQLAELTATMIKLFVDTINKRKGKWGIKINLVDLQTFERTIAAQQGHTVQ